MIKIRPLNITPHTYNWWSFSSACDQSSLKDSFVVSEKGPESKANESKIFAEDWDFQHDFSGAFYPHSNGFV